MITSFFVSALCGLLIGCINGFFVAKVKIVPFIVTLATYSVAKGLGLLFTNQQMVFLDSSVMEFANAKICGISVFVFIFVAVVLLAHFVLTSTQFGRQLFACGNNQWDENGFSCICDLWYPRRHCRNVKCLQS